MKLKSSKKLLEQERNFRNAVKDIKYTHGLKRLSRRDLLAHGLSSSFGMVAAPSLFTLLSSSQALGQSCLEDPSVLNGTGMPFLFIDLAGGGALSGPNIIVGKNRQTDFLSTYQSQGVRPGTNPNQNNTTPVEYLGLMWHPESIILKGIQDALEGLDQKASVETNSKGVIFASISKNDTGNGSFNEFNPLPYIYRAGVRGQIADLAGNNAANFAKFGSHCVGFEEEPLMKPFAINSLASVKALAPVFDIAQRIPQASVSKVLKIIHEAAGDSLCSFKAKKLTEEIRKICGCSFEKSHANMTQFSEDRLSVLLDPTLQPIWKESITNPYVNQRSTIAERASFPGLITKLLVDGFVGAASLTLGGYDYHNNNPITLRAEKDYELGRIIGQALASAAAKQRPLCINIVTDGGIRSSGAQGTLPNQQPVSILIGDIEGRSSAVMLAYHPQGVKYRNGKHSQIGKFGDNELVVKDNVIAENTAALAQAFVANYMSLIGEEGKTSSLFKSQNFIENNMDQFIAFDKAGA